MYCTILNYEALIQVAISNLAGSILNSHHKAIKSSLDGVELSHNSSDDRANKRLHRQDWTALRRSKSPCRHKGERISPPDAEGDLPKEAWLAYGGVWRTDGKSWRGRRSVRVYCNNWTALMKSKVYISRRCIVPILVDSGGAGTYFRARDTEPKLSPSGLAPIVGRPRAMRSCSKTIQHDPAIHLHIVPL
jgi:hypothetical protein